MLGFRSPAALSRACARRLSAEAAQGVREDIATEFCESVPGAKRVDVADAGHMVAGDRNEHFIDAIVPFLGDPYP